MPTLMASLSLYGLAALPPSRGGVSDQTGGGRGRHNHETGIVWRDPSFSFHLKGELVSEETHHHLVIYLSKTTVMKPENLKVNEI